MRKLFPVVLVLVLLLGADSRAGSQARPRLNHTAPIVLASVIVDLNGDTTPQLIYTVPDGAYLVINEIVIYQFSPATGSQASAVFRIVEGDGDAPISVDVDLGNQPVYSYSELLVSAIVSHSIKGGFIAPFKLISSEDGDPTLNWITINPEGEALTARCNLIGYLVTDDGTPIPNIP